MGDFHGDYQAALVCLRDLAKVLRINKVGEKKYFKWIGGKSVVVILGDILDRHREDMMMDDEENHVGVGEIKDEEVKILKLLSILSIQARYCGGRLIKLMGNHELMNLNGNFNYVSKMGLEDTGGEKLRKDDLKPGKYLSKLLFSCGMYGLVKVGDWVFMHGGLSHVMAENMKKILSGDYLDDDIKDTSSSESSSPDPVPGLSDSDGYESDTENDIKQSGGSKTKINLKLLEKVMKNQIDYLFPMIKGKNKLKEGGKKNKELIKNSYFDLNYFKKVVKGTNNVVGSLFKKDKDEFSNEEMKIYNTALHDPFNGILWYRGLSDGRFPTKCDELGRTFDLLGLNNKKTRVVVAHSTQYLNGFSKSKNLYMGMSFIYNKPKVEDGRFIYSGPGKLLKFESQMHGINYGCNISDRDGHIWRIDVAMSRSFDNKKLIKYTVDRSREKDGKESMSNPSYLKALLKARRPQVLKIEWDGKNYTPNVIMARKGLPRKWLREEFPELRDED